ncbi:MAG: guanylate kinase [Myxococcales bacterium]|nr:guanylate kinase [Myxococcales bacterium]
MTTGGLLIILSAPSGTGKSTLVKLLLQKRSDLELSISHTTRPPRSSERDGVEYHFVTAETFENMVVSGQFAEYANVYRHRYGTSNAEIARITGEHRHVVFDIDVQGAKQLMSGYPDAVSIFVLPPSLDVLENRLRGRGTETEESFRTRFACAQSETDNYINYRYTVVNDVLDDAVSDILSIIRAEELRSIRQKDVVGRLSG